MVCVLQIRDSFAVCSVLDERSRPVSVKNCHGGNAYCHHCKTLLKKIEASKVFTDKDNVDQPNKKYYMRYKHLNEHYAHQVSREILDFCKENMAGIIVLPEYFALTLNLSKAKIAVRLYKRTARQPGVRAEMLAGFPEEIEEYIIPPEEKCDICGGK